MHPFLVPGAWLLEGSYFPSGKAVQRLTGVTEVHSSDDYPETLLVEGEVRDSGDSAGRPVRSTFHLDVVSPQALKFRMDSLPLGTVLVGGGYYDDGAIVLRYAAPERRILGFESFVAVSAAEVRHSGVLLADDVPLTAWLARLERVRRS